MVTAREGPRQVGDTLPHSLMNAARLRHPNPKHVLAIAAQRPLREHCVGSSWAASQEARWAGHAQLHSDRVPSPRPWAPLAHTHRRTSEAASERVSTCSTSQPRAARRHRVTNSTHTQSRVGTGGRGGGTLWDLKFKFITRPAPTHR